MIDEIAVDDLLERLDKANNSKVKSILLKDCFNTIKNLLQEYNELKRILFPYQKECKENIGGFSWNSFYLIGDPGSLRELRRLQNIALQVDEYQREFSIRIKILEEELLEMKMLLEVEQKV